MKERKVNWVVVFSFIIGAALRLFYIYYTPITVRQNDVHNLDSVSGHIGYIKYFIEGGKIPFPFSPFTRDQYYHPPLHHMISAYFIKFNLWLGATLEEAFENLQLLTLAYSLLFLVVCFFLMQKLKLSAKAIALSFAVLAFHPALIRYSGSINNDMLVTLLITCCIYEALVWFEDPNANHMFWIGLTLCAASFTKLSGLIVVPFLFTVIIVKLFQTHTQTKEFVNITIQSMLLGIISIPVCLFWSLYHFCVFGMPLGYVPYVSEEQDQFVGNIPVWERFFGLKNGPFNSVFESFSLPNLDYNLPIALCKNSAFGESTFAQPQTWMYFICSLLLVGTAVMIVLGLFCLIFGLFGKKRTLQPPYSLFLLVLYFTNLILYLRLYFTHPHICSTDTRYLIPAILVTVLAIGAFYDQKGDGKKQNRHLVQPLLVALVSCFALFSTLTYVFLFF